MTLKFRCLAARKRRRLGEKTVKSSRTSSRSGSPDAVEDKEGEEDEAPRDPVSVLKRNNDLEYQIAHVSNLTAVSTIEMINTGAKPGLIPSYHPNHRKPLLSTNLPLFGSLSPLLSSPTKYLIFHNPTPSNTNTCSRLSRAGTDRRKDNRLLSMIDIFFSSGTQFFFSVCSFDDDEESKVGTAAFSTEKVVTLIDSTAEIHPIDSSPTEGSDFRQSFSSSVGDAEMSIGEGRRDSADGDGEVTAEEKERGEEERGAEEAQTQGSVEDSDGGSA